MHDLKIYTLEADVPLTKTYSLEDGEIQKSPYPMVSQFTSHEHNISTIKELYDLVIDTAKKGHCLLKGRLNKDLYKSSRAGSTESAQTTKWLCLDIDGAMGFKTADEYMHHIGLGDVSYVVQYSSSYKIINDELRCHIFVLLKYATSAPVLKAWLQSINLTHHLNDITLSRTGAALKWPLDITTCQNDKLIYVADPILKGIKAPKLKRIELIEKTKPILSLKFAFTDHKAQIITLRDKLRRENGFTALKKKPTFYKGTEVQGGLGEVVITEGPRYDRGFVYFNINGGDSWAYYHPEDNWTYLYNFKGEPAVLIEEVMPDYWAQCEANKPSTEEELTNSVEDKLPMVFRDKLSDQIYNGYWYPKENRHEFWPTRSEKKAEAWMLDHNRDPGEYIPVWSYIFDPHLKTALDVEKRVINNWQPTNYYTMPLIPVAKCGPSTWPTIDRLTRHVIGNDEELINYYYNWSACVFQFLDKTGTSWIFHGVFGTGKNLLGRKIFKPILGNHCVIKTQSELQSQFNSYLTQAILVIIDEAEITALDGSEVIDSSLKNWITEYEISVRGMYKESTTVRNYTNFIFNSNKNTPVVIMEKDRRYNPSMFQTLPCPLSDEEIDDKIPAELPFYFSYLMQLKADRAKARKPLQTKQRADLIALSKTTAQAVADAVATGDLDFLIQQLPDLNLIDGFGPQAVKASAYVDLMRRLLSECLTNRKQKLNRDELFIIFDYCVGSMPNSPTKFGQFLHHKGIKLKKIRYGQGFKMGVDFITKASESTIQEGLAAVKPSKTQLKVVK